MVSGLLRFTGAVKRDPAIATWLAAQPTELESLAKPWVGFFHGASLPDRAGLLEGRGRYMRHVKLKPGVAFNESALEALITAAYRDIGMRVMFDE